jgi:glycosyltransferase involved in cell wall biosynthesis
MVSVIMPVYNASRYLPRAITSILSQTVTDFEFLIIDDYSTDNSWEIIRRFAKRDKRIRIFRNTFNRGLVYSLNTLIPKTRGTYVARMDADDISLPQRFAMQIALLENNPRIVACGGQEDIVNERGRVIAEKYFPTDPTTCYNMITNVMVIQPPLLMARGNVVRKLKYDNHIFKNDDISLHFKLLEYGSFSNVDDVIFRYRRRPDSLTNRNPRKVYFLALLVRLNAMLKYNFRPAIANVLMVIPESLLVLVLPNRFIISLFEFFRFAKTTGQNGITQLKLLFAKAAYGA